MTDHILSIDQSTQGTKALLFSDKGVLIGRADLPHRQIIDEHGWVEHDPEEIYANAIRAVKNVLEQTGTDPGTVRVLGISNQRETGVVWNRRTGKPVCNAIVWQCARAQQICERIAGQGGAERIRNATGLQLSPYFTAGKFAWVLRNIPAARQAAEKGTLCCGTVDSWLIWRMTKGKQFRTDYSNASRTQLFNITDCDWDEEVCALFGIPVGCLAQVTDSDGVFGYTDLEGILPSPVPIHAVLGDSNGALFGQGCVRRGMTKATYGTGSSVMMNIGEKTVLSDKVVTSLAWKLDGKVQYVLEGNVNYTGAAISWLKDDLQLITSAAQTQELAEAADPADTTYLIPAFTGLGAPWWNSGARAAVIGMSRSTRRQELVKAALESIAYQISDVLFAMEKEAGIPIGELRADGGAAANTYLMQFQSDIAGIPVQVPSQEELSGIGAAYAAGIAAGYYDREQLFAQMKRRRFEPGMPGAIRKQKYEGWVKAVETVLNGVEKP